MSIPGDVTARAAVEAFGPFPRPACLLSLQFATMNEVMVARLILRTQRLF